MLEGSISAVLMPWVPTAAKQIILSSHPCLYLIIAPIFQGSKLFWFLLMIDYIHPMHNSDFVEELCQIRKYFSPQINLEL